MAASLEESPEQHVWTFDAQPITQLCVDRASCRVESWSLHASFEIRFAVPFRIALADGSSREIDPEASEQVAPMLTAIGREVVRLVVTRRGALELSLSDGSVVSVDSHPRYEAFEVNGGGALEGMRYLAARGGGVPWGR
ncbi:MAG: DUF6188 family protein [bacterium]